MRAILLAIIVSFQVFIGISSLEIAHAANDNLITIPFQGDSVNLYRFPDDGAKTNIQDPGVKEINDALLAIIKWFRYVFGAISTTWIVWQGYLMLTSNGDDGQFKNAQTAIIWGVIALTVSFLVEPMVKLVMYGGEGGLTPGQAIINSELATQYGRQELTGFMKWIKTFLGMIAVAMIVFTGVRAMATPMSDDGSKNQVNNIIGIVLGIIIIIFNEIIINYGLYGSPHLENNKPVVQRDVIVIIREFAGFIGFYLTLFTVAGVAAMIYGGYLYLTAAYDEGQAANGKKIMINVGLGIIIVLFAYVVVRTVIYLQS